MSTKTKARAKRAAPAPAPAAQDAAEDAAPAPPPSPPRKQIRSLFRTSVGSDVTPGRKGSGLGTGTRDCVGELLALAEVEPGFKNFQVAFHVARAL